MAGVSRGRVIAVAIMIIVAFVHAIRGAALDAWIWAAVVGALGAEAMVLSRRQDTRPPGGGLRAGWVAVAAAVLAGGIAVGAGLRSWPVRAIVIVAGLLVLVRTFAARVPEGGPTGARRAWPWAVVAVSICLIELASFVQQPDLRTGSVEHPTLSVLIDPLLASPVARGVAIAAWLLGGCLLLRGRLAGNRR